MENVCGLHRPEQSVPEGQFPLAQDRLACGFNNWAQVTDVHGRVLRIQPDQENTSFVMSQGLYCYKVMPFGLKNAGAIYQRLVNRMFSKQIGRNMEVYVDDMLVKSREELAHLDDLKEMFTTLKQYQMKLNPAKCVFGVASRKFLGFMVS